MDFIMLPAVLGAFVLLAGGITLLAVVVLWRWRASRRQRLAVTPPPTASTPYLKSSDDSLYFRLDRLAGEGLVIGRGKHGVDLAIHAATPHADTVSEQHARIYHDPVCGCVVIEDLGSIHGIFINGRRAPRKNLLKDGWVIGLGKLTLTYRDGESDTGPLD